MRVALIVPGGVDRSGTERVIPALLWLIERLARLHQLRVYALAQEPEPCVYPLLGATVENLGVRSGGPPGLAFLRALTPLRASLAAFSPDVIHAFWADTPGLLAAACGRSLGIPWIVSLGGGELAAIPEIGYGSARTLRGRMRTRLALLGASRVTAASGFLCALARERGIAVEQVPLGVDPGRLATPRPIAAGTPYRLVQVGSLNPVKDQATLLRTFRRILDREPASRLDIVGEDTLAGAIQRLAASLGLDDAVTFHGALPSSAVFELLGRADLLLVTSRHEAGPVVVLEAAALGIPTVGTAVGHVADFSPELAVAVPVGDAEALAERALELLHDGERRAAMGRRVRAFAGEWTADATAARFGTIYRESTGGSAERKPQARKRSR